MGILTDPKYTNSLVNATFWTIIQWIQSFNYLFLFFKTVPSNDVEWIVTPSGSLKLSWLKKIAEYKETEKVSISYTSKETNNTFIVDGTAKEVKVLSLRFGDEYVVTIKSKMMDKENHTFSFIACKSKHYHDFGYFQTFYSIDLMEIFLHKSDHVLRKFWSFLKWRSDTLTKMAEFGFSGSMQCQKITYYFFS